jgi:hypothetical protein
MKGKIETDGGGAGQGGNHAQHATRRTSGGGEGQRLAELLAKFEKKMTENYQSDQNLRSIGEELTRPSRLAYCPMRELLDLYRLQGNRLQGDLDFIREIASLLGDEPNENNV